MPTHPTTAHQLTPVHLLIGLGGDIQCLYTEVLDLTRLGKLKLRRISRIEFNQHRQRWQVLNLNGRRLFSAPSRQACLTWEQKHFGALTKGAP